MIFLPLQLLAEGWLVTIALPLVAKFENTYPPWMRSNPSAAVLLGVYSLLWYLLVAPFLFTVCLREYKAFKATAEGLSRKQAANDTVLEDESKESDPSPSQKKQQ